MRLIERKDCPMRHENGNCTVAGGFCTAVSDPICEALRNAYYKGSFDCAIKLVGNRRDDNGRPDKQTDACGRN